MENNLLEHNQPDKPSETQIASKVGEYFNRLQQLYPTAQKKFLKEVALCVVEEHGLAEPTTGLPKAYEALSMKALGRIHENVYGESFSESCRKIAMEIEADNQNPSQN